MCHHVKKLILVNLLGCVSKQEEQMFGLLKHKAGRRNREISSELCRSLVRPLLEYACPVQSPYLIKEKLHLAIENL